MNEEWNEMDRLFDRLFPICRSITGPGLRETLSVLGEYAPLERFGVRSGTEVFDWTIPPEWRIREAWLEAPDGRKIVDFRQNNLHVVNYSAPVDQRLSLEELREHLYTVSYLPEAIPYVTSYYKRRWGFCLSHREFEALEPGMYHARIDSEWIDGELNYAHAVLPGESGREVLISSYVCHPSMANNELSGPIVAAFLYRRLAKWRKRRFAYRFVFVPETIGSIAYLHQFGRQLKRNTYAGLVLTCLGGKSALSYKRSRREQAPIDQVVSHLFQASAIEGELRPFTPAFGSDERQYGSPGFNLPVGQMARMVYGTYPGYHNSLDDKETMTIDALQQSVDELERVLLALELDGYYVNRFPYGEVKLDKHGLYPDINRPYSLQHPKEDSAVNRLQLDRILSIMNYSDGEHRLHDIAGKCGCSILDLEPELRILLEKGLIEGPYESQRGLES